MRKDQTIYINDRAYSREILLLDMECLFQLQRQALKTGFSISEILNKIILKEIAADAKA